MTGFAISDSLAALLERQRADRASNQCRKPQGYQRPSYGTDAYRADYRAGWISWEEWEADERASISRAARARASRGTTAPTPTRWQNRPPQESRQYAAPMATAAARDARLTPQAKALLQVIRARCGAGRQTQTTKGTLAAIMSRHARSIQRYIGELQRFGYIETKTRRGDSGLFTGLVIRITEQVTPFFAKFEALAGWLAERGDQLDFPQFRGFPVETTLSPKNHSDKIPSVLRSNAHAFGMT